MYIYDTQCAKNTQFTNKDEFAWKLRCPLSGMEILRKI